jgi:serine/threonine-protein kinase
MIGTILDNRYEILEKIGEGGMAQVYKAKCNLLQRYVAIKVLKSQFYENEEFVEKFKDEALAIAVLSHDNIVNIYDIGNDKNLIYIIMEYVEGTNLKKFIKESGVINYDKVLDISVQIASALKCAHAKNIIHRDVKPHNILITTEGNVKVADFGIAKATTSSTITNSDRIVGSAHYISPEQAKGNVVDFKTDIYSLGVVIYEMVTGNVPFNADSPIAVALKHIQEDVEPPININKNIPNGLNNIILKALEKEKFKRYHTASEILNDLIRVKNNPNYDINFVNDDEMTRIIPIVKSDSNFDKSKKLEFSENDEDEFMMPKTNKKKIIFGTIGVIIAAILVFFAAYIISGSSGNDTEKTNIQYVTIPNIVGMQSEEAEIELEKLGLEMVITEVESSKEKGTITQCYPYEGTEVDVQEVTEVKVLVSLGVDTIVVPNVLNSEIEAAKKTIVDSGLVVGNIEYAQNGTIEKNFVISQSLSANSEVQPGETINLIVSEGGGTETTYVPNLIGKKYDEAVALIGEAKLALGTVNEVSTTDQELDNQVVLQSIQSDSQVAVNTEIGVTYYIYKEEMVTVPDVVGKSISETKSIFDKLGLVLSFDGENSYIVVSQNVSANTKIEKGSTIIVECEPDDAESSDNAVQTTNP